MDNIANKVEPRGIDGQSVESEYAIEHPLKGKQSQSPDSARALDLFSESVRYLQDGDELKASTLLQEALEADPSLHSHACEALLNRIKSCHPEDEGAIYYWLGIHTQYLEDYRQAESWYAKAIDAFQKIGYPKREGRAHCNLGRVKMKHEDPSGMEEFEKAIALNPMDGIAHIDIGTVYFFADQHERALDAFAEAVWATLTDMVRLSFHVCNDLDMPGKKTWRRSGRGWRKSRGWIWIRSLLVNAKIAFRHTIIMKLGLVSFSLVAIKKRLSNSRRVNC
jgi:tetratricopeptide (TPR) repeat protein